MVNGRMIADTRGVQLRLLEDARTAIRAGDLTPLYKRVAGQGMRR